MRMAWFARLYARWSEWKAALLSWLREKVHHPGRRYEPAELVQRICGRSLDSTPFVSYLHEKYRGIYLAERRDRPRR